MTTPTAVIPDKLDEPTTEHVLWCLDNLRDIVEGKKEGLELTLDQVADQAGVARGAIYRLLHGTNPTLPVAAALLRWALAPDEAHR